MDISFPPLPPILPFPSISSPEEAGMGSRIHASGWWDKQEGQRGHNRTWATLFQCNALGSP